MGANSDNSVNNVKNGLSFDFIFNNGIWTKFWPADSQREIQRPYLSGAPHTTTQS